MGKEAYFQLRTRKIPSFITVWWLAIPSTAINERAVRCLDHGNQYQTGFQGVPDPTMNSAVQKILPRVTVTEVPGTCHASLIPGSTLHPFAAASHEKAVARINRPSFRISSMSPSIPL